MAGSIARRPNGKWRALPQRDRTRSTRQPPTQEGMSVSALHRACLQLGIIDASVCTFPRPTVWCTPKG